MTTSSIHTWLQYFLLAVLAVILLLMSRGMNTDFPLDNAVWRCVSAQCVENVDVIQWQKSYCVDETGDPLCTMTINGVEQKIPLSLINLTYLSEQCLTYLCTQEIVVRDANYTSAINPDKIILQ